MKEEGDRSSERQRKHGRTAPDPGSIIPEWASFPPELVQHIAYCVLSTTGGVDAYMDMRAVCPSWRSAVARPPPLAAFSDHRFRPRHWVMLDLKSKNQDDDARLFLHTTTGRFRRLSLPVLREHHILGASDGLIVLMDREQCSTHCSSDAWGHPTGSSYSSDGLIVLPEHPRLAHVLNPLTGDMLHYAAPLWEYSGYGNVPYTAVSGGPRSALVAWQKWDLVCHTVLHGYPTCAEFTQEYIATNFLTTMVTFQGDIYLAGLKGSLLKFARPGEQRDHELVGTAQMPTDIEGDNRASSYLVESAGELLLVRHRYQTLKIFRVDVEKKLLEEVRSLGCHRALFLGNKRCVSVEADKLPSVDGDCIYMINWVKLYGHGRFAMHRYNLWDGTVEIISNYHDPMLIANCHDPYDYSFNYHHLRPHSLIQILLDYCNDDT